MDLELLFRLRLVVARFGEMDKARWWNSRGQLGAIGAKALARGFPRTHHFAQARSVFAIASARCDEIFAPPNCVTLWRLPESIEEEFDARWEHWLDHASDWNEFFTRIESLPGDDLVGALKAMEMIDAHELEACSRLRRSAEGRSVPLPGLFQDDRTDVVLLAAAFGRSEPGHLAVPYQRLRDR